MAAMAMKREAPNSHTMHDEDLLRSKKIRHEEEHDNESDTDDEDQSDATKNNTRLRSKKTSDTHPHRCDFPGCDRAYTRAEHLHRHQLEHKLDAKHYKCHFEGCTFGCVRKDLLERHLERHSKEGSNLWRRDRKGDKGKGGQRRGGAGARQTGDRSTPNMKLHERNGSYHVNGNSHMSMLAQPSPISPPTSTDFGASHNPNISPVSPMGGFTQQQPQIAQSAPGLNGFGGPSEMDMNAMSSNYYRPPAGQPPVYYPQPRPRLPSGSNMTQFDPSGYHNGAVQDISVIPTMEISNQDGYPQVPVDPMDPQGMALAMDFNQFMFDETFTQQLIEDTNMAVFGSTYMSMPSSRSHPEPEKQRRYESRLNDLGNIESHHAFDSVSETSAEGQFPTPSRAATPMVSSMLGPKDFSDFRYQQIFAFIQQKFENVPVANNMKRREGEDPLFRGHHVEDHGDTRQLTPETRDYLTQNRMNEYLGNYWREYAPQIPIIHPSLDPNRNDVDPLLLLAMIAIGATSANRAAENEIASFIAWNVRSRVQNSPDLVCPTRTWALQTLVLLEAFEKLFSNRLLHERSHQFHGLTVELVRRSEYFEGKASIEVDANDLESSWEDFVEYESRKRAAYTVFTTDLFHACMFSHKAITKVQEIELALPCSDSLWECKDSSSFWRAFNAPENNLTSINGAIRTKRLMTLDELLQKLLQNGASKDFDKVLQNTELQQNTFIFKAILAGTISLYWEYQKLSSRENCTKLLRNLESWIKRSKGPQSEELTELYAILTLAQINLRTNVIYLQQIACPTRILGKTVTGVRRNEALKALRRWVRNSAYPDSSIRNRLAYEAVCCAARFLTYVYAASRNNDGKVTLVALTQYNPKADHFLHRPWAVYIAVLCIWAYAYVLEGPIHAGKKATYRDSNDPRAFAAADRYIQRLMSIENPEQLKRVTELNQCLGLLTVLAGQFHDCQWELLREAGDRAEDCAAILKGELAPLEGWKWQPVTQPTEEEFQQSRQEREDYYKKIDTQIENLKTQIPDLERKRAEMRKKMERAASQGLLGGDRAKSRSTSQGMAAIYESSEGA